MNNVNPFSLERYTGPGGYFALARRLSAGHDDEDALERVLDACLNIFADWKGGIVARELPARACRLNQVWVGRRVN